jgi:hypothetical protein
MIRISIILVILFSFCSFCYADETMINKVKQFDKVMDEFPANYIKFRTQYCEEKRTNQVEYGICCMSEGDVNSGRTEFLRQQVAIAIKSCNNNLDCKKEYIKTHTGGMYRCLN